MSRLEDLRAKRMEVEDEIVRLGDLSDAEWGPGREEHWSRLNRQRDKLTSEIVTLEERQERTNEIREKMRRGEVNVYPGMPGADRYDREVDGIASQALRALDRGVDHFKPGAAEVQDELIRDNPAWAARFEACARPEYSSAFGKYLAHGDRAGMFMNDQERSAVADMYETRAQDEGTTTHGGFAVPVFIDPTVILSNQESDNVMLRAARTVTVNTNQWKGVSAAGVSWSFDAEGTAVSDDSITLAQPTVTVYMARGFVPASIEVTEDWPGFQSEMARLLATGYDELVLDKLTRGSGSGEPRGIITALDANTNAEVVTTTDGAFGQEDIYKTWAALPQAARRRASWMMSVTAMDRIRQFGDSTKWHAVTKQLPDGAIDVLFERPVYENPYFPDMTALTTGAANYLVVGDFGGSYVVAQRSGMSIEVIPMLLDTASGRPTYQRGYAAWARIGGNSVLDTNFRLLQNQ